jgi:two-component system CheB/CheR fusion protein
VSPTRSERDFEALLDFLKRNRGFDFTGYKRPSLARRIEKRMGAVRVKNFADYQDFLEVHPEEFSALFNTILINITAFFRDAESWTYLADHVLPNVVTNKSGGVLRLWSAGCASGEEAYTLAMLVAEQVGIEAFRDRVKIYATDVDEEALTKARQGVYTEAEVEPVPDALRKKYFEESDGSYVFRKDLRRQVIFGRHDLINDAPISRVDLLVCRNTLMYLNSETQSRILARFHFALTDGGILFLGRAETLLTHASTFEPVDLRRRISTKVPRGNLQLRDRLVLMAQNGNDEHLNGGQHGRLRDLAADSAPLSQLIVDQNGVLVLGNERARTMFDISAPDVGRPLQDLKVSYRPLELRSLMDQARTEHRVVVARDVEWQPAPGDVRHLDVHISTVTDAGAFLGWSISFTDVSAARRLQREVERSHQELEATYEELQSTNEELETTNEELQSTVEELETTNEELQSTNEELETMNEELQSTNEELTTMNDEMRDRGEELSRLNLFLESVLANIDSGVIVLDNDLHVVAWSRKAEDLWGLREHEVTGKNLLALDMGFPVSELKTPLKQVLSAGKPVTLDLQATNRRGRGIGVRVTVTHLQDSSGKTRGAILLMEEHDGTGPPATKRSRE